LAFRLPDRDLPAFLIRPLIRDSDRDDPNVVPQYQLPEFDQTYLINSDNGAPDEIAGIQSLLDSEVLRTLVPHRGIRVRAAGDAVIISRPDKGVTWNLMPEEEMYMEIPLDGTNVGAMENMEGLESRAKAKVLGKETVSGYECEKRSYEGTDKRQGSVIVWFSSKLDYPVKIEMTAFRGEEGMTLEYRNIKPGKIPDSKFEIPSGYEKFAIPGMPSGMPGGIPKMPGMGN
jgi:hypothetical protein